MLIKVFAGFGLCLIMVACGGEKPVTISKPGQGVANQGSGKPSGNAEAKMQQLARALETKQVEEKSLSPAEIAALMDEVLDSLGAGPRGKVSDLIREMDEPKFEFEPGTGNIKFTAGGGDVSGLWLSVEGRANKGLQKIASITERKMVEKTSRSGQSSQRQPREVKNKELWGMCFGECDAVLLFIAEQDMIYPIYIRDYNLRSVPNEHRIGISQKMFRSIRDSAMADGGRRKTALTNTASLLLYQLVLPYNGKSEERFRVVSGGDVDEAIEMEGLFQANQSGEQKLCLRSEFTPYCSESEQDAEHQ